MQELNYQQLFSGAPAQQNESERQGDAKMAFSNND
jgi:hypothetical protein